MFTWERTRLTPREEQHASSTICPGYTSEPVTSNGGIVAENIKISETNRSDGRVTLVAKVKLPCRHELFREIRVADNKSSIKAGKAVVERELKDKISEHFLSCKR
jgi:hypothetical protein